MDDESTIPYNSGMQPTTSDVLAKIGLAGVIVGSFPRGGTKDIDVVVRPRHPEQEGRNPIFQRCLDLWREHCDSSAPGHLVIYAHPVTVELFDDKGWVVDAPEKHEAMMTFRQACRASAEIDAFGVTMRAVF